MTETKTNLTEKEKQEAAKSPAQKLREELERKGASPEKAAMVVNANLKDEAVNKAESAKKKEPERIEDKFTYFDHASAKILQGSIPEDEKEFSLESFLEELCEYGAHKGFRFNSLEELQIICGSSAYMTFINIDGFSPTLSNCNQHLGPGWFQIKHVVC